MDFFKLLLANVKKGRRAAQKQRYRFSKKERMRFCRKCNTLLQPGVNCKVRTCNGRIISHCENCNKISKY